MMRRINRISGVLAVLGLLTGGMAADRAVSATGVTGASGSGTGIWTLGALPVREPLAPQPVFSDANTGKVVKTLQAGEAACARLPVEYRTDCLARSFKDAAKAASAPDYRDARKMLNDASRTLAALAKANADPAAPALRVGGKSYRAVKKPVAKAVNRKAAAVITETETRLLRSSGSARRKTHFQSIARAVGSTKKLLRS